MEQFLESGILLSEAWPVSMKWGGVKERALPRKTFFGATPLIFREIESLNVKTALLATSKSL